MGIKKPTKFHEKTGLSDISSSEGNLRRFSSICELLISHKPLTLQRIKLLVRREIGLTNEKVIHRHIRILERLGILEREYDIYVFTGIGKILCEFLKENTNSRREMSAFEERLYFERLFHPQILIWPQLSVFLDVIYKNQTRERNEVIIAYFKEMIDLGVWKEKTIRKNLNHNLRTKRVSSFFLNRFRCQEKWLRSIELLKHGDLVLSETGVRVRDVFSTHKRNNQISLSRFALIKAYLGELRPFEYYGNEKKFTNLFEDAGSRLERNSLVSIDSLKHYIFFKLLNGGEYIDDLTFINLLDEMSKKNVINSVMMGRNGKPNLVVLSS